MGYPLNGLPFIIPTDPSFIFPQVFHATFDPCVMTPHPYPTSRPIHHYPQSNRSSISASSNYSAGSNNEPTVRASRHLFIQNLSPGTTSQQLREYFQTVGIVDRCDVLDQRSFNRTKVCAAVSFHTEDEARNAIAALDNTTFMGVKIRVRFNRERSPSSSSQPKPSAPIKLSAPEFRPSVHPSTDKDINGITVAPVEFSYEDNTDLRKRCGGPLVVNGSCVNMKAGRGEEDKPECEGQFLANLPVSLSLHNYSLKSHS